MSLFSTLVDVMASQCADQMDRMHKTMKGVSFYSMDTGDTKEQMDEFEQSLRERAMREIKNAGFTIDEDGCACLICEAARRGR